MYMFRKQMTIGLSLWLIYAVLFSDACFITNCASGGKRGIIPAIADRWRQVSYRSLEVLAYMGILSWC